MKTKLVIAILIILLIISLIFYFDIFNLFKPKGRPEYCDNTGCVPEEVFRKLPKYPPDFEKVRIHGLDIEKQYPDENYYKQPEFLGSIFIRQGMPHYTKLSKPHNFTYMIVAGYGASPSDINLQAEKDEHELTGYIHASWAVVKYQGLSLDVVYPKNPDIAKKCFDVTLIPKTFLLGRTYLSFDPDWIQRVKIKIKVNENCPKGDYLIGIVPTVAPKEFEDEWIKIYGTGYMPLGIVVLGRPLIQIRVTKSL